MVRTIEEDPTNPPPKPGERRVLGMEPWGRGPCKAPTFIWLSLAMLAFSFSLHVAAMATTEWAVHLNDSSTVGLFSSCANEACKPNDEYTFSELGDPAAGTATQAFACLMMVTLVLALFSTLLYIFKPKLRLLWLVVLVSRWATLLFLSLTLITWAVLVGVNSPSGFVLGTSFGMDVFGFILEMVGALAVLSVFKAQH